jgi:hypothetical protein
MKIVFRNDEYYVYTSIGEMNYCLGISVTKELAIETYARYIKKNMFTSYLEYDIIVT